MLDMITEISKSIKRDFIYLKGEAMRVVSWSVHYYYNFKQYLNDLKVFMSPVYITSILEFTNDGKFYDIKDYVNEKLKKDTWIKWEDISEPDTDFIITTMMVFGKKRRVIMNKELGWNNMKSNDDVVYAYLDCRTNDGVDTHDVTDLLKEFLNLPADKVELKFIEIFTDINLGKYDCIELVLSKIFEIDEITISLKN